MKKLYYVIILLLIHNFALSQSCKYTKDHNNSIGSTDVSCNYNFINSCIQLQTNFPTLFDSNSYEYQSSAYQPVGRYNQGTAVNAVDDDKYVKKINFADLDSQPFIFHFYGKVKNSLIISSNGFISFNDDLAEGDYSSPDLNNQTLPNIFLPENSIYGSYHDLVFNEDDEGEIFYYLTGEYPCRKLIINFYRAKQSGSNQRSTFQIVLNEMTSNIQINIESKPTPTPETRFKQSLIGIKKNNLIGIAAQDRNTGIWQAQSETYLFTPNGNPIRQNSVRWTNSINNTTSTANSINVCSIEPSIYTATATFQLAEQDRFTISSSHQINLERNYPIAQDYNDIVCNSTQTLTQSSYYEFINAQINPQNFRYKFYTSLANANANNSNFLPQNQNLQNSTTYYVRIENNSDSTCYDIAKLTIGNTTTFPPQVEVCDSNNDGSENILMADLTCQIFPNNRNVSNVRYYVDNGTTPVTRATLTENSIIRVQFNLPGCSNLISSDIRISFIEGTALSLESLDFESYEEIFDIVTNNNPIYTEPFNWLRHLTENELISTISNDSITRITAHNTRQEALENRAVLSVLKEGNRDRDFRYNLFLRIETDRGTCKGNCFSILPVNARVKFDRILLNISDNDVDNPADDPNVYDEETADIYYCGVEDRTIDLNEIVRSTFIVTNPGRTFDNYEITFHQNYGTANNITNSGINPTIVINNANRQTIYVRFRIVEEPNEDGEEIAKYIVKPLIFTILPKTPLVDKINICVDYSVNNRNVTLSSLNNQLLTQNILNLNPRPIIEYYSDENLTNRITTFDVTRQYQRVWVKIKYQQTETECEQISPLDLKIYSNLGVIKPFHEILVTCDNNNDIVEQLNLTNYLSELVEDPSNYEIAYFRNYNANNNTFTNQINNATNFEFRQSTTVYVRIRQRGLDGVCNQKLELRITYDTTAIPQIKLKDETHLLRCNIANNNYVYYNLDDTISDLYLVDQNPDFESFITGIKYYETLADANRGGDNYITNPSNYALLASIPRHILYVRYESSYGCFNVKKINLQILGIVKIKDNLSIQICDDNFDGFYNFNIRNWINERTLDTNENNDIISEPITNRFANYKIFLNQTDFLNGIFLTPEQEENFIFNPSIHRSIIIHASVEGGCEDHMTINLDYVTTIVSNFEITDICDEENDLIENINLTRFESNFANSTFKYYPSLVDLNNDTNEIEDPLNYTFNQNNIDKIYFKILGNNSTCPNLGIINIQLKTTPIVLVPDYLICPYDTIEISPNFNQWDIESIEWVNPQGNVFSTENSVILEEPGTYHINITATNGCTYVSEFTINHYDLPTITNIVYQQNSATVVTTGNRTVLYSKDGITWQSSSTFDNLPPGVHYFYAKYQNENCVVGPFRGLIPVIFNAITPNGDGINDYWKIKDLDVFNGEKATLEIFDRFGKRIYFQESNYELIWNGKVNNKPLPSTSYWYNITLPDGRTYTSYITLINKS